MAVIPIVIKENQNFNYYSYTYPFGGILISEYCK
ncbi:hypothetical protein Pedsa_1214 [Pseudopedobacter saltans DSM 12145]|uniref:Uncharacterized protein n=1 Tax=Pseudopedobacter saltans (strain ATCC 51119 / DSM 12145 / JCM 21818 / CCUG 39354 / LMG 10337 / NBRC 100064 / NCIMB 13643) TaxID=762903 RepID=F0SD25_PSESL|nr:hypothetical protein Pedsa_1214 [Pseudopedobacter saltans DSM 12145]